NRARIGSSEASAAAASSITATSNMTPPCHRQLFLSNPSSLSAVRALDAQPDEGCGSWLGVQCLVSPPVTSRALDAQPWSTGSVDGLRVQRPRAAAPASGVVPSGVVVAGV